MTLIFIKTKILPCMSPPCNFFLEFIFHRTLWTIVLSWFTRLYSTIGRIGLFLGLNSNNDLTSESLGLFRAKLGMSPTQSSANIPKTKEVYQHQLNVSTIDTATKTTTTTDDDLLTASPNPNNNNNYPTYKNVNKVNLIPPLHMTMAPNWGQQILNYPILSNL